MKAAGVVAPPARSPRGATRAASRDRSPRRASGGDDHEPPRAGGAATRLSGAQRGWLQTVINPSGTIKTLKFKSFEVDEVAKELTKHAGQKRQVIDALAKFWKNHDLPGSQPRSYKERAKAIVEWFSQQ